MSTRTASAVPLEAKTFTFTPEALAGMESPPEFVLRYGTVRDRHAYQDEVALRGLRSHSDAAIRAATIDEIRTKWAIDTMSIEDVIDAVQRYFSAIDDLEAMQAEWRKECAAALEGIDNPTAEHMAKLPPAPEFDFDPIEREAVENLLSDVEEKSERLRRMARDNLRRDRESRRLSLAMLLQSTTLDVPFTRTREGLVSEDTLYAIEGAMLDLDNGREAFAELGARAVVAFFLTGSEEKNSASPAPTGSGDSGSIKPEPTSSTTATLESPAADGDRTPAKSSPKPTSN